MAENRGVLSEFDSSDAAGITYTPGNIGGGAGAGKTGGEIWVQQSRRGVVPTSGTNSGNPITGTGINANTNTHPHGRTPSVAATEWSSWGVTPSIAGSQGVKEKGNPNFAKVPVSTSLPHSMIAIYCDYRVVVSLWASKPVFLLLS
jgi:hypothetical protein